MKKNSFFFETRRGLVVVLEKMWILNKLKSEKFSICKADRRIMNK